MTRSRVIKIAVVLFTAVVAFAVLRRRPEPLLRPARDADIAQDSTRLHDLRTFEYDRHDVPLWSDRSYHTFQFVQRLKESSFAQVGRNEERPYVIEVSTATTLFTLANRLDLHGVEDWRVMPDTVLVDDSYAPRRFDVLLGLEVAPGAYIIRSPKGGPSKPVFFNDSSVRLKGRS